MTGGLKMACSASDALTLQYYDEPDARKVITPEMIVKMHQTVKAEDPVHPVCVNLCQRLKFKQYLQGSDIASFDN